MKLLIITNLFPNAKEPGRAAYNLQQFYALSNLCELKVVAPLPCFQYSKDDVPYKEVVGKIDVFHPRYLVVPRMLRWTYGLAFFIGVWHTLKIIHRSFKYDTLMAAWGYPDAFGTAIAARLLNKKFFVMVLGSDINLAHRYWCRPAMIKWALNQAKKVIAVSHPLKQKMIAMGIPKTKIVVISNGVDTKKFYPRSKDECRLRLSLDLKAKYILYVGNFAEVKGVVYLIRAFALLVSKTPGVKLVLIGDGEQEKLLKDLIINLGVSDYVQFTGRKPHQEVPEWMAAVDVFCLPSLNEGCPNVLLEAMACGVKIVASNVGGVPDIIDTPEKGWLAKPKDMQDLTRCLDLSLKSNTMPTTSTILSWDDNAGLLFEVLHHG